MLITIDPVTEDGNVVLLISGSGNLGILMLSLIDPTGAVFTPTSVTEIQGLPQSFAASLDDETGSVVTIVAENDPIELPSEPTAFLSFPFDPSFAGELATREGGRLVP